MKPSSRSVAARYVLQKEVQAFCKRRLASGTAREITAEVLLSFTDNVRVANRKVAFNLITKLKTLWGMFTKAPDSWEKFKNLLGVSADNLMALPSAIKHLMSEGEKALRHIGDILVEKIPPLRIYLEEGAKLPALGVYLEKVMDYLPAPIKKAVEAIATKAKSLAEWLDSLLEEYHPLRPMGALVSAGVFAYIWFNAVEISWDIPEIIKGFLGLYTFQALVQSLPESLVGMALGFLFPGIPGGLLWNVLLPITVALRISWLVSKKYASISKKGLEIHWGLMGIADPMR